MDRPHLARQQLSSTQFCPKGKKFTRPAVSRSTRDPLSSHFLLLMNPVPPHATPSLACDRGRQSLLWGGGGIATSKSRRAKAAPPRFQDRLEPVAIIAERLMFFLILSPTPQVKVGGKKWLCRSVLLLFNSGGPHEYCNTTLTASSIKHRGVQTRR